MNKLRYFLMEETQVIWGHSSITCLLLRDVSKLLFQVYEYFMDALYELAFIETASWNTGGKNGCLVFREEIIQVALLCGK